MMNPASYSLQKIKREYNYIINNPLANLGFTLGLEKEGDY